MILFSVQVDVFSDCFSWQQLTKVNCPMFYLLQKSVYDSTVRSQEALRHSNGGINRNCLEKLALMLSGYVSFCIFISYSLFRNRHFHNGVGWPSMLRTENKNVCAHCFQHMPFIFGYHFIARWETLERNVKCFYIAIVFFPSKALYIVGIICWGEVITYM